MRSFLKQLLTALMFSGVLVTNSLSAATVNVAVGNDFFSPSVVTINIGDTVRWTWNGNGHNIVCDNPYRSGTRDPLCGNTAGSVTTLYNTGNTYQFTYNQTGTYRYYCNPHISVNMTGMVVVAAANAGPPIVNITSPVSGTVYTAPGAVVIQATASDPGGSVVSVQFKVGSTAIGTDTTSPYSATNNSVPAGTYTLSAIATDNQGALGTNTNTVTIIVNSRPSVSLTTPTNGTLLPGPATFDLTATASDSDGSITNVSFYRLTTAGPGVIRTLLGSDTTAPYSVVVSNAAMGFYHFVAEATDNRGTTATSSESLTTIYSPFLLQSPSRNDAGEVTLTLSNAAPGMGPIFPLMSTDLLTWVQSTNSFVSDTNGAVRYIDQNATNFPWRFYRAKQNLVEAALQ
jgi:plastocyanin